MSITKAGSTRVTMFFAAIVLAAGSVAGCTGPNSAPDASSSPDETSQTAESETESASHSDEAQLPEWFVGEFPVHPDLRLSRKKGNEPEEFAYYFKVGANRMGEMYDWFTTQYAKNGWEITDRYDNQRSFHAEKAGGYQAQVHVTGVKNVTTIVSLHGSIKP